MKNLLLSAIFVLASLNAFSGDTKEPAWQKIDQTQYVGAQKCAECHATHYTGWQSTTHSRMIRKPVTEGPDKNVLADFTLPFPDRTFDIKDVKWVVGSRWKQRFIGVVNGQEVVYPVQWSVKDKTWQPYTGKADWWYANHKDWKTRSNFKLCAGCHSTGSDAYTERWTELNISCEACHGPGKTHSATPKIDNIVNPTRLTTERSMDVCLQCHLAGKPEGNEYAWPVGYQAGMELSKFWKPTVFEEGKTSAELWSNGTAHKNRVQGNTFQKSVMHGSGIQCSTCHESHGALNKSSTVKRADTNALCMTCHGPGKTQGPTYKSITEHTGHAPLSTGSQCIECHMPKTGSNAGLGEARNHTFDFISPSVTIKTGNPNSCNGCHADKTPDWALTEAKKWYPKLK
ncbi:MAG: cytochrome c3 family protein [Planctomycetota bacterium]